MYIRDWIFSHLYRAQIDHLQSCTAQHRDVITEASANLSGVIPGRYPLRLVGWPQLIAGYFCETRQGLVK